MGLTPRSAARFGAKSGVLVLTVRPESPAAKSGLRAGDMIETINGQPFRWFELRGKLRNEIDDRLALGIVRAGQRTAIKLSIGDLK
ncbi:MAG: PDZ domain-containing protein [Acidobacteria bacterium]|nr:PDZ domain-containing protein [Acidobacteriota bacterium]